MVIFFDLMSLGYISSLMHDRARRMVYRFDYPMSIGICGVS